MTYQNNYWTTNSTALEDGNVNLLSDKAPVFRLFTQAVFVGFQAAVICDVAMFAGKCYRAAE